MNKTKAKLFLFVLLSLFGLAAGFFFAGYLNLLFSGGGISGLAALRPENLLAGFASDSRQRMLSLCVMLAIEAGIAALMLLSRKETFESDIVSITKGIKTPVAIGQGQHGTARWMRAEEKRKAFSVYRLDSREISYFKLLKEGRREWKEVAAYPDEDCGPGGSSAGTRTESPAKAQAAQTGGA
jgi:type IV secretion system protein VirD4